MPEPTKYCPRCKVYKSFPGSFYRNKGVPSGYTNYCKECSKEISTLARQTPKGQEYIKAYYQREEVKQSQARNAKKRIAAKIAYDKQYKQTPHGKELIKQSDKRRRSTPEGKLKDQARLAVRNEVRAGRMPHIKTLTCKCGVQAENYHHHNGYDRNHWLDVIPVCKKCHTTEHFGL